MKIGLLSLLMLAPLVFAGEKLQREARTQKDMEIAQGLIYGGTALLFTIVGIPAGAAMIAADNGDGTRSCWTKVLDKTDITDEATYNLYEKVGIPVEELLKHTDAAIYAPSSICPRVVVRNRRAEVFILRPTANDEDGMMYHLDPVPKMITWY